MTPTENKFALIGAGPAGLAGARNLQKEGIPFDGFELNSDVGGLWDINAPRSTMYESAHLISSKRMTEFTEFPMQDSVADYPSHRDLREYFIAFAKHFDLYQYYHFGCEVLKTEPESEGAWNVTWKNATGEVKTAKYRGVIIANGTLSEPNMPKLKGNFDGEIMHSSQYKSANVFTDKRVLIVGAGNSGCDIAVDAVHHAKSVDISLRRGYHFVPKYVWGKPADAIGGKIKLPFRVKQFVDSKILGMFTGDPVKFGLPEPDHKLYESHPIVNSLVLYHLGHGDIRVQRDIEEVAGTGVHFKDGEQAEYDLILLATGYKLHYPFIESELLNWKGASPHLYLNCFHPERDDVFVLGLVEAAGIGWQGRFEQAELVAKYIAAADHGTNAAEQFKQTKREPFPDMRAGIPYLELDRMAHYVHKDSFRGAVTQEILSLSDTKIG